MTTTTTKRVPLHDSAAAEPRTARADLKRLNSSALLGDRGELIIEHAGREYRLRKTSTGRLILTA